MICLSNACLEEFIFFAFLMVDNFERSREGHATGVKTCKRFIEAGRSDPYAT
jgi:hypothetical protein